ncbi:CD15/CS22/SEF14 family fimbrial major subunit [Escherichia coli B9:H18]|uniref:CD15/CS22/SEF14 family fimbrial major subunit n=1 Tax=Escherichia coli TaxID=562 RepID=UPI0005309650|nr:CD15/CS22/SEF14 family fimbrial major subunit [Escherichia coli]
MKFLKSSVFVALAMAMSSGAIAASDVATVTAKVSVVSENMVNAVWNSNGTLTAGPLAQNKKLGTLSITSTGTHDGFIIGGEGSAVSGGVVNIPFKNAQGQVAFRGKLIGGNQGAIDKGTVSVGSYSGPGWQLPTTDASRDLNFGSAFKANLEAGDYTATFYVKQYNN